MSNENMLLLNNYFDRNKNRHHILMKNVDTEEKKVYKINNPTIPIYKVKDDVEVPDYFMEYRDIEDLEKHDVSYRWREWDLARLIGYDGFTNDVRKKHIKKEQIYLDKRLFGADVRLTDRTIMDYLDSMGKEDKEGNITYPDEPPIKNLHIGFFDLEWDIRIDSDDEADYPIYLMTYFDSKENVCHTFYLEDKNYKYQDKLLKDKGHKKFIKELKKELEEDFSKLSLKNAKEEQQVKETIFKRLDNIKYELKSYSSEQRMIRDFYKMIIRDYMPDFLYAYNTSADIGQTLNRCDKLNIKPSSIFCHPDVGDYVDFRIRDNTFPPEDRKHNYECASYTKIMDMFITYHAIRGASSFTSYKLDTVAKDNLGVGKLDYSHICDHIGDLPYRDFYTTTKYNIRDVLVMPFIEDVTQDTKTMVSKRFTTRTEYDQLFTSMAQVMNAFFHMGERNGQILSNEVNKLLLKLSDKQVEILKEEDRVTYDIIMSIKNGDRIQGGLCTDPNKVTRKGIKLLPLLNNKKVFETVIDADASSMYPNNLISHNITKTTLVGKLIWIDEFHDLVYKETKTVNGRLIISRDDWAAIKKMRSKSNNNKFQRNKFLKMYRAIKYFDYKELANKSIDIDIMSVLEDYGFKEEKEYMPNLRKIFKYFNGSMIDKEEFEKDFPDKDKKDLKHTIEIIQIYIKNITSRIGERAIISLIQRNIIEIGEIFFNLPNLTDLDFILNNISQKEVSLVDSHDDYEVKIVKNKLRPLLSILSQLDSSMLNDKDLDTGLYKTNGMFYIGDKKRNYIRYTGTVIEYFLESGKNLTDVFEIDEPIYTDRRGNVANYIYEEQVKVKEIPDINGSVIFSGEVDEENVRKLKLTDRLSRRLDFKTKSGEIITINLNPRMVPCIREIESLHVKICKTEHDSIYDVIIRSEIPIEKPHEDKFIYNQYMKILNY